MDDPHKKHYNLILGGDLDKSYYEIYVQMPRKLNLNDGIKLNSFDILLKIFSRLLKILIHY